MMGRVWALVWARNLEFLRDRSTLGWNILLPILLVAGLAAVFGNGVRPLFKVGVVGDIEQAQQSTQLEFTQYVSVATAEAQAARARVGRHQLDALLDVASQRYVYNPASPKGAVIHRMLQSNPEWTAVVEGGGGLRYIDWLLPGILGMNIMFSCLFGVGYVIVRYRKSGYLKRLSATPVTALDFVLAQILSRLLLILVITVGVFVGTNAVFDFPVLGSYLDLFLLTVLGCAAMVAIGLLVAARVQSEELAGGLLNFVAWPMMVLSGVWFSLEGAPQWVQQLALAFPLTHLLTGARSIMFDGVGIGELQLELAALGGITLLCIGLGALIFRWRPS